LWEVATGECLASTQTKRYPNKLVFDADGTSVIAKSDDNSAMEWRISPATTYNHTSPDGDNDNRDDHLSLPMVFVPIHDIHQPLSTDVPVHQRCYQWGDTWILDEKKRRICLVLPDLRRLRKDCNGTMVALGRDNGMVTIIDISGVHND